MAEGGSSKQTGFNLSGLQAGTVNIVVNQVPGEEMEGQETKDSQSGNKEKPRGPRLESDGCAVFENLDGTFGGYEPNTKQKTVELTRSITMFASEPLYPGTRVYRGKQNVLGRDRDIAIKILPLTKGSKHEAHRLLSVEHPNIVRVLEAGDCFGTVPEVFIAMELCGKNLQEYANENKQKPFDFEKSFSYSKQLIAAVAYIHKNKVVHRDLKPGNILISICGNQIKVADLGLSKDVGAGQSAAYVTTISAGSEGFKAPETFGNSSTYAYKADIFPLGINVYYIFTNGEHPYGSNPFRWAVNIMDNTNRDLSHIPQFKAPNSGKRTQLISALQQMLEHNPDKRPTAEQILKCDFFNENLQTVTRKVEAMKLSTESAGNRKQNMASKKEQIRRLENELKKPLQEIGFENASQMLKQLQNLRGTGSLDISLQLAECHLHLMKGDEDSSIEKVREFVTKESRSARNVRRMGLDLQQKDHYVQAMILYKISHDLHKKEKPLSPDDELEWIRNRVIDIKLAIEPLLKAGGKFRQIAINYGIKFMDEMLSDLRAVKNTSPDARALKEASCLNNIASINNDVGECEKSIRFRNQGVRIMEQQFGEKASSYKLYSWLLNNLGAAYNDSGNYTKAEHCYVKSIGAKEKAIDYENEEERQENIALTKRNLEKTRNLLAKQK